MKGRQRRANASGMVHCLHTATYLYSFYRQNAAIKPSVVRSHNEVAKGKIANGNLFANLRILAFEVHSTATDTTEAQQ